MNAGSLRVGLACCTTFNVANILYMLLAKVSCSKHRALPILESQLNRICRNSS